MKLTVNDVEVNLGIESMRDVISGLEDKSDFQNIYHEIALSKQPSL